MVRKWQGMRKICIIRGIGKLIFERFRGFELWVWMGETRVWHWRRKIIIFFVCKQFINVDFYTN